MAEKLARPLSPTALLGLLGWPVAHSLSPAMQNAAFTARGLAGRYELWPTPPDELAHAVARLREPPCLGANVTVPHKTAILPLLDEVQPDAAAIGAVNTVVVRAGRLIGYNTDSSGFWQALTEAGEPPGDQAIILGAGGAARAVAWALLAHGWSVLVLARRAEAAHALAATFTPYGAIQGAGLDEDTLATALVGAALLVNSTPVGMWPHEGESPLPPGLALPPGLLVADLVYRPRQTRLLQAASAAGCQTLDGLGMLLHQGAAAFTLWTGQPAPLPIMRAALDAALQAEN